jgi:hypothetical protein
MLFLQGTEDQLAQPDLLHGVLAKLGSQATLTSARGADHAFHVLAKTGRTNSEVLAELLDSAAAWMLKQA